MVCPQCGAILNDGDSFCASCGARVSAASSDTANTASQAYGDYANQQQYGTNQQYNNQQYGTQQQYGYQQQQQYGYQQQYGNQQQYGYQQQQYNNQQQYGYQQQQYGGQSYGGGYNNASSASLDRVSTKNPVWCVPYSSIKSPLFIIAAAAVTITFLFNIIYSFSASGDLSTILYQLFREAGLSYSDIAPVMDLMDGLSVFSVVTYIPDFVIVIGIWLTFFLVVFTRPGTGKTGGLTTIKVILIIDEVFVWIEMFLIEIIIAVMLAGVSGAGSYYGGNSALDVARIVIIVLLVIVPVLFALVIAFYKGLRHSINTVKNTLNTGNASYEVSNYAGVMCIIMSALSIISMIGNFANSSFGYIMEYGSIGTKLSYFTPLFSATALMLFGILLVSYRGKMTRAIAKQRAMENGEVPAQNHANSYPNF